VFQGLIDTIALKRKTVGYNNKLANIKKLCYIYNLAKGLFRSCFQILHLALDITSYVVPQRILNIFAAKDVDRIVIIVERLLLGTYQ
jgi:hypothetical protein